MRLVAEECGAPPAMVDAGEARTALERLFAKGCTWREVSRLTGLSKSSIHSIVNAHWRTGKPVARVRRETLEAILAAEGKRSLSAGQYVGCAWMAGWLRDYRSQGVPIAAISRACGIDRQVLDAMVHGKRQRIRARTLYEFVKHKPAIDRMAASIRNEGSER